MKFDKGMASFSSLIFFAQPNSEVFFKATTFSITRYFGEFLINQGNFSDWNNNNLYAYVFSIKFRECITGEIFIKKINRFQMIFLFFLIINFFKVVTNVELENIV